jgi:aspartokinase/homoserine dehydrogenase 1
VPVGLDSGSSEEFLAQLPKYDADMKTRYEAARARGHVLRYVGRVTADGKATVGLMELDGKHAFANIALTDNIVRYATARYCNNPLIVQGPGAGPRGHCRRCIRRPAATGNLSGRATRRLESTDEH